MTASRVLVVDDEPQIHRFLKPALVASGHEVECVDTGAAAIRTAATWGPDLILLDLGLPDLDGKEVVRAIREWSKTPIIILSARDRESEKIAALDLGADDYVNKPFGVGELLARLRAALRHAAHREGEEAVVTTGGLVVDTVRRVVARDGERVHLTPKEYELLTYFAQNKGIALTREQILSAVWGYDYYGDDRTVDAQVKLLRSNLGPYRDAIITLRGVGYKFEV